MTWWLAKRHSQNRAMASAARNLPSNNGHLRRRRRNVAASFLVIICLAALAMQSAKRVRLSDIRIHGDNGTEQLGADANTVDSIDHSDMCVSKYPWISSALDEFFKPSINMAKKFKLNQTNEEAFEKMAKITWVDDYHPGHDVVTLEYDAITGGYAMTAVPRFPANQEYKRQCILQPLQAAINLHGRALADKFKRKQLKFVLCTEDFGMIWRNSAIKLPAFAMCTDEGHADVPVPDFTYGCYPETHYTNSSWTAISDMLNTKSTMIPWKMRESSIFFRGNWGVGPRQGLMPFLSELSANGSDVEMLGASLDIADSGFIVSKKENFVWLDDQCTRKVAIHTAGFSYSAALKYKLACGALVLKFDSVYREFYEPGLIDGVHVISLPAEEKGVDVVDFIANSAPKIREAVSKAVSEETMPAVAAAGKSFALEQLSSEALSCYWFQALVRYGQIYFSM